MRFLYLFFILFLVIGCKKGPIFYEIKGLLLDEISKEPISEVSIKIYERISKKGIITNNYTFVNEVVTDAKGEYYFKFERKNILDLKFEVNRQNYYDREIIYGESKLTTNNVNNIDILMEANAWFKLIIINSYIASNEQLNLYKSNFKTNCDGCCTNGASSFFEQGDTTIICDVVGGETVKLIYGEVTVVSNFTKEILCKRFDTTSHIITY